MPFATTSYVCMYEAEWRISLLRLHLTGGGGGGQAPGPQHWQQRYFVCDEYWKPSSTEDVGPIFFYCGNEANVELCVAPQIQPFLPPQALLS
jgi:hypothetical protein